MIRFLFAVVMSLCALATAPAYGLEFRQGYSGGNCDHCAWIAADGAITADSDKELLEFMRRKGIESYSNLLVINSPGGDLRGGLKLGELMRLRKMTVIVGRTEDQEVEGAGREFQSYDGGVCASACVFVLMGGVARELADDESRVGIHQFAPAVDSVSSEAGTTARTQTTVAILQSFAMKMGVDPSVITLASMTNSDDIYWLSIKSMESSNLLTTRSSAEPSDWTLKPVGTSLAAFARQEQSNGLYTGFFGFALCHRSYPSRMRKSSMPGIRPSSSSSRILCRASLPFWIARRRPRSRLSPPFALAVIASARRVARMVF